MADDENARIRLNPDAGVVVTFVNTGREPVTLSHTNPDGSVAVNRFDPTHPKPTRIKISR